MNAHSQQPSSKVSRYHNSPFALGLAECDTSFKNFVVVNFSANTRAFAYKSQYFLLGNEVKSCHTALRDTTSSTFQHSSRKRLICRAIEGCPI